MSDVPKQYVLHVNPLSKCSRKYSLTIEGSVVAMIGKCLFPSRKKMKKYARTLYRHECEPVTQMLNTADRFVA